RPVRVEARAFETSQGYPVWQAMEESAYAWGALKQLPETVRDKKEVQLQLNMAEIMESLGDSLTKQEFLASRWRGQPAFAQAVDETQDQGVSENYSKGLRTRRLQVQVLPGEPPPLRRH